MRSASWMLLGLSLAWTADAVQAFPPGRPGSFAARWSGQDGQDLTGPGPSVGPDGLQDVHIRLSGLTAKAAVKAIRVEGPGAMRWESGNNPRLFANAELVRDAKNPSLGDLYFQPDRDLNGRILKLIVAYDNEKFDSASLVAGTCDAGLRAPASSLPVLNENALKASWQGQDGASPASPGDVHVVVDGLPASASIVGAVLTDSVRGTWIYRENDRVAIPTETSALPLSVKFRPDRRSVDLFLRPYRDDSKETMTLLLIAADGQNFLARFPGGNCDLGKMAPAPASSRIEARPGDDLQALVDQYGTVVLTPGTFRLRQPLVLNHPVTVTSDGGATLLFDQAPSEHPWSAAIKVHCGNTTLNGFALRFAGPVRWNTAISWGAAVIGMTDNLDPPHDERKENLTFTHLDIESPPVANKYGWVESPRMMRLIRSKSGVISGNVLRGGTIEFLQGPWRIIDNDYRGTMPGTFSHGVFTGHATYDLVLKGNRARDVGASGKTWRLLVLTWQGYNDVVERNIADGLGALEGDTIPWCNEPEIILTEAYHIRYEGKVMDLSVDGRLLRTGQPQSIAGRTGDVVTLLNGPAAGEWRRIVQAIDPSAYLVDRPIPAGTTIVSIAQGFIGEVFQGNRIDIRGGRKSFALVFCGNHFGTRIIDNHLLGGESAFKLTACPTETPVTWGWTHAPYLGGVIERNILEDAEKGGTLGVEHDSRYMKSNQGRTYMEVRVDKNTVLWSEPFLRRMAHAKTSPGALTIGYPPSRDPGELIVRAGQNRLEAPAAELYVPSLIIHAAMFNSQAILEQKFRLPMAGTPAPPAQREASKPRAASER
jgi:hypothetical protein